MSNATLLKPILRSADQSPERTLDDVYLQRPSEKRRNEFLNAGYQALAEVYRRNSSAYESGCNAFHLMLEFREKLLDHQTFTLIRLQSLHSVMHEESKVLARTLAETEQPTQRMQTWVQSVHSMSDLITTAVRREGSRVVIQAVEEAIEKLSPELKSKLPTLDQELGALKKLER